MRSQILFFVLLLFLIGFVNAEVNVGNRSYNIEENFTVSTLIKGWINISFSNEPADNNLSIFNNSIKLKDFLDKHGISITYSCLPLDCRNGYITSGSSSNTKTFSITEKKSKLFGMKVIGNGIVIDRFYFNISSNSGESCLNPLIIDLLDDNVTEWRAEEKSESLCYSEKPYGCFKEVSNQNYTKIVKETEYCERINIIPGRWFRIGAEIIGEGAANFNVSLKTITESSCGMTVGSAGEVYCDVKLEEELTQFTNAEVCIKQIDGPDYEIKYENIDPVCGSSGGYPHDFKIFAKSIKYKGVSEFQFDQENVGDSYEIAEMLSDYINTKYNKKCDPECIIPLRITSGIDQSITIHSLQMNYKESGLDKTPISTFYEINQSAAFINSNYTKLDLSKANFFLPSTNGSKEMIIKIGNTEVGRQRINITSLKPGPKIMSVSPQSASVLTKIMFIASVEGAKNDTRYYWKFFTNDSEKITNSGMIEYTYKNIGTHELTLRVNGSSGESSKTIQIKILPPKSEINKTIREYKSNLNNFSSKYEDFPDWIKNEIIKKVDIDGLNSEVRKIEDKTKSAMYDEEYYKIMTELVELKIPKNIRISEKSTKTKFIASDEQMNLEGLENLGATVPLEEEKESYFNQVNKWLALDSDIEVEYTTYIIDYGNNVEEVLFSHVKLNIIPSEEQSAIYFMVNGDSTKIIFPSTIETKDISGGEGVAYEEDVGNMESINIEFLYPDKINLIDMPIFIVPGDGDITSPIEPTIDCNNNGVCDDSEDYKSCRNDCKPWKQAIIMIIIIIIIALVIYLLLQEWYKRRYQTYLFKDKTQLFNLINFMYLSSNQGLKKDEIFNKLKSYKWTNEQLEFAWRKFKGQRTGMWEIPVFKWYENKEVKQELDKRKGENDKNSIRKQ